jgi:hypothetical protein
MDRLRRVLLFNAVFHVGVYALFALGAFGLPTAGAIAAVGALVAGLHLATFWSASPGRSAAGVLAGHLVDGP